MTTGKKCLQTTDCKMDHFCWPLTPTDAKNKLYTCNEVFKQKEGAYIGMWPDNSQTQLQNSLKAGMICESGIAKVFNETHAMCVKIA